MHVCVCVCKPEACVCACVSPRLMCMFVYEKARGGGVLKAFLSMVCLLEL